MISKLLVFVLVLLVTAAFLVADETTGQIKPGDTVIVTRDGVKFRWEKEVLAELKKGTRIAVVHVTDKWIGGHIVLRGKKQSGWIARSEVDLAGSTQPVSAEIEPDDKVVAVYRTSVRKGKEELLVVEKGTELTVTAVTGNWVGVRLQQGDKTVVGWVYAKHLVPRCVAPDGRQVDSVRQTEGEDLIKEFSTATKVRLQFKESGDSFEDSFRMAKPEGGFSEVIRKEPAIIEYILERAGVEVVRGDSGCDATIVVEMHKTGLGANYKVSTKSGGFRYERLVSGIRLCGSISLSIGERTARVDSFDVTIPPKESFTHRPWPRTTYRAALEKARLYERMFVLLERAYGSEFLLKTACREEQSTVMVRNGVEFTARFPFHATAIDRLWQRGNAGTTVLLAGLADPDPNVRRGAVTAAASLGCLVTEDFAEPLAVCLEDSDFRVRSRAASALKFLQEGHSLAPLRRALKDEHPLVRDSAASSLRYLKADASRHLGPQREHFGMGKYSVTPGGTIIEGVLKWLNRTPKIESLSLEGTTISDDGLAQLKGLTGLTHLNLSGTQVTDAGLKHLKGLTNLKKLDLDETRVTDAGLEHLKGLTGLSYLGLSGTQVAGPGLEHLKGLINLKKLDLDGTRVNAAGLEHLKGLTQLWYLWEEKGYDLPAPAF